MSLIQQIYATHCTFGTSAIERREGEMAARVLGYSARSSSWPQAELRKHFRTFERYLSYSLPADTPAELKLELDAHGAPRRLLFLPSLAGFQMLGQVAYRTWDTTGKRPGSYFGHLLIAPREKGDPAWDVLECLRLWRAPGWQIEDSPAYTYDLPTLESLRGVWKPAEASGVDLAFEPLVNDEVLRRFLTDDDLRDLDAPPLGILPDRWRTIPAATRRSWFVQTLQGYLEVAPKQRENVLLVVEPDAAVLFFYGIARLLPDGELRQAVSFSTFEPAPDRLNTVLGATHFHDSLSDVKPDRYLRGFVLNTFLDGKASTIRQPHPYAEMIVERLVEQGWEGVEQTFAAFHAGQGRTIQDLAELVRAREIGRQVLDPTIALPSSDWEKSEFTRRYVCKQLTTALATSVGGVVKEALLKELLRAPDDRALLILRLLSGSPHAAACRESLDYLMQRLPEEKYLAFVECAEAPGERKATALAYFVALHKRLPVGCEGLFEAALGNPRTSLEMQLRPLALPLLRVLNADVLRDLADRAQEAQKPALWACLAEAAEGNESKGLVVLRMARDMTEETLSIAVERLGEGIGKLPPEMRREIGLRYVQTLNSLHRSPPEFTLRLDRLRRVQRLIADLEESRSESGNLGPSWSPIERLNAWLRVPEIVKQAELDASGKSLMRGGRRGESQGDLQYRVGKLMAEALSRALPHRTLGEGMSTQEKSAAMFQVLQHLQATELVSSDWRNRAAYYLEYQHWHDAAGSKSPGIDRKKMMIAGGAAAVAAVVVLALLLTMSGEDEVAKSEPRAAGKSPSATGNSPSSKPPGASPGESVVPPPAKPPLATPPAPPGDATRAEQDLNSLPDSPSDPAGGGGKDASPSAGTADGKEAAGSASQTATVEGAPSAKPQEKPALVPPERDWELAVAPLKPGAEPPIHMKLPPVGATDSSYSPETTFRWVIWSQENVRLDATPLVVHGLKEATAPWRATKPEESSVGVEEVHNIPDGTPIRATDSNGTQYEIAKFFVHRTPGKVTLEMKLLNGISRNLFEIQRQLFFCVVEFSDTTGKKHFVSLLEPKESAAVPVDAESIKNGNLTSSTGLEDRVLRPEAGGELQRLFVARATLRMGDQSTVSVGGRSWREAPEHEAWPLKIDKIEGMPEGTQLGVRWAPDGKRSSLCVYAPKFNAQMLDQEITDLTNRSQAILEARRQFRMAMKEENETKRPKLLEGSIERLAKILDVPVKKFPERPNLAGTAEKRREAEAAFEKELGEFGKWRDSLITRADELKMEIETKAADAKRRKGEAAQRHANAERTLKESAKSIEAELFRVVPTKDGRRIRVPVMVYPSKDL